MTPQLAVLLAVVAVAGLRFAAFILELKERRPQETARQVKYCMGLLEESKAEVASVRKTVDQIRSEMETLAATVGLRKRLPNERPPWIPPTNPGPPGVSG